MRRSGRLLAVALSVLLVGCGLIEVQLLTGGEEVCSIRAGAPTDIEGLLVTDSESGTAIEVDQRQESQWPELAGRTVSVRWPAGYTGRRTLSGAVEVLNAAGEVAAVTGTHVWLGLQFDGGPTGPADAFPACAVR